MPWQIIVALVVIIPVILLPVAFVWMLNLSGFFKVMREVRKRRAQKASVEVGTD